MPPGPTKCGVVAWAPDHLTASLMGYEDGRRRGLLFGLVSCHSVHECPVCAPVILAAKKPARKVSDSVNRTMRSLEVTREGRLRDNGWHPHLHEGWLIEQALALGPDATHEQEQQVIRDHLSRAVVNVKRPACTRCKRVFGLGHDDEWAGGCPTWKAPVKRRVVPIDGMRFITERWQHAVRLKLGPNFVPDDAHAVVITILRQDRWRQR